MIKFSWGACTFICEMERERMCMHVENGGGVFVDFSGAQYLKSLLHVK